ncbi:MAG TPA: hypothetical protein VFZ89_13365 [Solirubrobacteraceae bacterium]
MRSALLLCALALALTACGAEPRDSTTEFKGDERAVAKTVEDLETAARDDDSTAVCTKLLAEELLTALKAQDKTCATAVKDAFRDADAKDLTVDEVTISGERATAKVTSGTGNSKKAGTLQLERSGAGWRITSL